MGALQLWGMSDKEFATVISVIGADDFFSIYICFMVKVLLRMSDFKELSLTINYQ